MASIPLPRTIRYSMNGPDVRAIQIALRTAGFRQTVVSGKAGVYFVAAVKGAQRRYGLPQSGVYGLRTHRAMQGRGYFGTEARRLLDLAWRQLNPVPVEESDEPRAIMGQAARVIVNNASLMNYTQSAARMEMIRRGVTSVAELSSLFRDGVTLDEDCSSSFTGIARIAGIEDPNSLSYNGTGYTGTMQGRGREVNPASAPMGAAVFYGRVGGAISHMAMSMGDGNIFTFGSEPPRIRNIWYREGMPMGGVRFARDHVG